MYTSFYNLREKPFRINPDPKFLWLGEKHKEALAVLKVGLIEQKGFLLLTGDVGSGKTTLVNALLQTLGNGNLVASITDPNLDLMGFLNSIARAFNISRRFERKEDFLVDFKDFLTNTCLGDNGKRVFLIIDEAHNLSKELLEQVRLLSNIELPERKLLNIFLVGQNELNHKLMAYDCRALRQRITLSYNIESLSENETREYIKHRLEVAGTKDSVFSKTAIQEIYRVSGGSPRLINVICDRALLTGYAKDQKKISQDVIQECAQKVLLPGETKLGAPYNPRSLVKDSSYSPVEQPPIKKKHVAFSPNESGTSNSNQDATVNERGPISASQIPEVKREGYIYGLIAVSLVLLAVVLYPMNSNRLLSVFKPQQPISDTHAHVENKPPPPSPVVSSIAKQAVILPKTKDIIVDDNHETIPDHVFTIEQAKQALKEKDFKRAMEILEYLTTSHKGTNSEIKALYVQVLREQAILLSTTNKDQTEKLLRKALETDPQNVMIYADLAKNYAKKKDFAKAVDAYLKVIQLNPDSADAFFNLGFSYAAIKDYTNAEKMFLHASELKPSYLDKAIVNLALVQYKQGKQEQCLTNLKKALEINPNNQKAAGYLKQIR